MGRINKTSILSGILIGIGVVINVFSANKYIGALLFSFALLVIVKLQLQLYTGQIGFLLDKKYNIVDYIHMLLYNMCGALIPTLLLISVNNNLLERMIEISCQKLGHTYYELFIYGLFCGVLMMIAVYCKETIITVFCIMIFILSGYEHCIADFPFLLLNISFVNIIKFSMIVLGNSVGAVITYSLIKAGDGQ